MKKLAKVQSSETMVAASDALHTFLMPFLVQVRAKPIDYTPLSRCNGSDYRYLESAGGEGRNHSTVLGMNEPIYTDTCMNYRLVIVLRIWVMLVSLNTLM